MASLEDQDRAVVRGRIDELLRNALEGWEEFSSRLKGVHECTRHGQMAELNLRWQARLICGWQDELDYIDEKRNDLDPL